LLLALKVSVDGGESDSKSGSNVLSNFATITRDGGGDVGGEAFDQRRLVGTSIDFAKRPQTSVQTI
jgi:hypothetical protein